MAGIANVFNLLKNEFEEAQKGLKNVDDNIKKITGREPGVVRGKGSKRTSSFTAGPGGPELEEGEISTEEPLKKKRFIGSAFSRVHVGPGANRKGAGDQVESDERDENPKKPTLQSSVIATQRETKPRLQALEEQKSDKKSMARNKRMFGMILGTLQKFQSEESRRKETTQKRVEIEKKLDEAAEVEKELIKKERRELYRIRREKQAQIRRIELKMERVQIHQEWEKSQQFLAGFIQTKTKPHIFYMPVKFSVDAEKRLKETKDKYRLIVAEKRAKVQKELSDIDELYKKDEHEAEETEEPGVEPESSVDNSRPAEAVNEPMEVGNDAEDKGETDEQNGSGKGESQEANNGKELGDDASKAVENSDSLGDKEFEPIYDE